jgi:hypothetical protein
MKIMLRVAEIIAVNILQIVKTPEKGTLNMKISYESQILVAFKSFCMLRSHKRHFQVGAILF